MDKELIGFLLVAVALVGMVGLVSGVSMPGTIGIGGGDAGSGDGSCTIESKIGVEGTFANARMNTGTFRYDTFETGAFGFSWAGSGGALSWTGADNVELQFELTGPIEGKIGETIQIGELSSTDGVVETFKASNLPPGQYQLEHRLYWGDGKQEPFIADITIPEGC